MKINTVTEIRSFTSRSELWRTVGDMRIRVVYAGNKFDGRSPGYVSFQLISPEGYVCADKTIRHRGPAQAARIITSHSTGWATPLTAAPLGLSAWARVNKISQN